MFNTPKKRLNRINGFTLLELIMVILIIGILAVVATPKWRGSSINLQYEARRVLNDIRYTQALSIATGQRYTWVRTSASSYQVTNETGTPVVLPNGNTTLTLSSDVSFGVFTNLPNNLVAFNSFGTPYTTSSIPGTALASLAIITLSNSSDSQTISITPTTGYGAVQ